MNNENLKQIKHQLNYVYGKNYDKVLLITPEGEKLLDILCRMTVENNISSTSIPSLIHGIQYIYASALIEISADQIKLDVKDGTLTVNNVNKEDVLIYMCQNSEYYAYNLYTDSPMHGEELEKGMGWL